MTPNDQHIEPHNPHSTAFLRLPNSEYISYENEYEDYEKTIDPTEATHSEIKRLKQLIVTQMANTTSEVATNETVFTNESIETHNFKSGINYLVIPVGYVEYVEWTEYNEDERITVEVSAVNCQDICRMTEMEISKTSEVREGGTHYHVTVSQDTAMLHFVSKRGVEVNVSAIEIMGKMVPGTQATYVTNNKGRAVMIVKAPQSITKQGSTNEFLMFDHLTNKSVCKERAPMTYLSCVFTLTQKQLDEREVIAEGDNVIIRKNPNANAALVPINIQQIRKPRRAKRGILELLKTGRFFASDYADDLVVQQVKLEEDRDELLNDEVKTISDITDHIVESTQKGFDVLELSLCLLKEEQFTEKMQAIISQKIYSMFQTISKVIEDCSFGLVTTEVDISHLNTLCVMYILTKDECDEMLPVDMRQLFRCQRVKMEVESMGLRLKLAATMPGLASNYKAYQIHTIPVFEEEKAANMTRTLVLRNTKVFETDNEYLSFEECRKSGGITLCDAREARNDDSLSCVKALINSDLAEAKSKCIIRTEYSNDRCYVKDTESGFLVSSLDQLHGDSKLFEKELRSTGVSFVKRTKNAKNFVCGKRIVKFDPKDIGEIKIVRHDVTLNLSKLMESERIPYVERRALTLDNKIKNNSVMISDLVGHTNSNILRTDQQLQRLNVKLPNNSVVHISSLTKLLMGLVMVASAIVILYVVYLLIKRCCLGVWRSRDNTASPDTVSLRRERLNRDTPSRYSRYGTSNFRRTRREDRMMEARL